MTEAAARIAAIDLALSTQGPLRGDSFIDPDSYRHILAAFSRGIFDAKRQQRLVRPQHLLPSRGGEHDAADAAARYPVLIAAAFYTAADEDLDFLVAYALAGGHLVVGPRTGYGDEEGRARTERAPARITGVAGVWYDELASLPSPVPAAGLLQGAATDSPKGSSPRTRRSSPLISIRISAGGPPSRQRPPARAGSR